MTISRTITPATIKPINGVFGVIDSSTGNAIANTNTTMVKNFETLASPSGESN